MSQFDDKVVYAKLQGAVNYRSWKQNMISLFKKERAYEIATGQALKPVEPIYQIDLTKLQFRDKLRAERAAQPAVSSIASTTITPQSGDSAAEAQASQAQRPPPPPAELTREDLDDAYQAYLREWEIHEKWLEKDSKAYDIMRRHTEDDCKPTLGTGTSFEAWSAVENTYRVITFAPLIEAFQKMTQRSETFKTKAALTATIQQAVGEFSELAGVSSSVMRQLEPFFLYLSLGEEFYHLKEQIKAMKQSEIDPEKIRSLINGHAIIASKPAPSASFTSGNKRKAQEGQSEGQSQSGKSNKKRKKNQTEPKDSGSSNAERKKCTFCKKPGHIEKDCWEKDPSKRPPPRASIKANSTANTSDKG